MIVLSLKWKTLRRILVSCVAVAFVAAALLWGAPAARFAAAGGLKPVYAVDRDDGVIAISFDASWGAERTEELLAILAENDVKTTFFLVNLWIERYPELVEKIAAAGHEIGLHSATHPHFSQLSAAEMEEEILANQRAVARVTGKEATLFRPPYGDYNDEVIATVNRLNLTAVQWSVDSLDWKGLSAAEINDRVLAGVAPGAIVLLHNDGENTAEALKSLLPAIKERGYAIVPVGELLLQGESYVDQNGLMRQGD